MSLARWIRWAMLSGMAGPIILFQAAGCVIDPDIFLRAGLQIASEVAVFALDNLLVGLR